MLRRTDPGTTFCSLVILYTPLLTEKVDIQSRQVARQRQQVPLCRVTDWRDSLATCQCAVTAPRLPPLQHRTYVLQTPARIGTFAEILASKAEVRASLSAFRFPLPTEVLCIASCRQTVPCQPVRNARLSCLLSAMQGGMRASLLSANIAEKFPFHVLPGRERDGGQRKGENWVRIGDRGKRGGT